MGRVLDISKYEHVVKHHPPATYDNAVKHEHPLDTTRAAAKGMPARVYRFPSPTPGASVLSGHQDLPIPSKGRFRLHLVVELTVGFLMWLTWILWQHLH